MNLSDFSVTWAYTRGGGLYTGSFGSRGFRGAYTRGGLYTGGLILGVLRYFVRCLADKIGRGTKGYKASKTSD